METLFEKPSVLRTTLPCRPGMGAIPTEQGTTFRVWAPFAEKVFVVGPFNEWQDTASPLAHEANGFWATHIGEAQAGHEYKFVIQRNDQKLYKNDPYARAIHPQSHNGVIHRLAFTWDETVTYQLPSHNELVIYEMHVGTFNPSHPHGVGTFEQVIARLPYLKNLGINVIELLPVKEFPTDRSWGYNPVNPFAVENQYGGPDGLKQLVQEAHRLGIGIIMDVVYNHFGPQDLDLWQFDGWQENNLGGIYFYNDWRAWTPWGENRPDYGRPEVRQYIRDNALFWLEEFKVDGLRFDGVAFIRTIRGHNNDSTNDLPDGWSLLRWINEEIHQRFPHSITIAEDLLCNEWLTKPTEAGGAGFHSQWDAAFVHPIRRNLILPRDEDRNLSEIKEALYFRYDADAFNRVIYSESHDEVANGSARIPTEIDHANPSHFYAQKRSLLAAALVFTAPGIPMIFQGQEFLEDEWFRDDVPIDWSKLRSYRGINRLYRDLIHLRTNRVGLSKGLMGQHLHVFHLNHDKKIIAFHRWMDGGAGDDVVVVANFSHEAQPEYAIAFPHPGQWKVRCNSDWKGYSHDFTDREVYDAETYQEGRDGMGQHGVVTLAPYSFIILSQDAIQTTEVA